MPHALSNKHKTNFNWYSCTPWLLLICIYCTAGSVYCSNLQTYATQDKQVLINQKYRIPKNTHLAKEYYYQWRNRKQTYNEYIKHHKSYLKFHYYYHKLQLEHSANTYRDAKHTSWTDKQLITTPLIHHGGYIKLPHLHLF